MSRVEVMRMLAAVVEVCRAARELGAISVADRAAEFEDAASLRYSIPPSFLVAIELADG